MQTSSLSKEVQAGIQTRLEHPFSLMFEAVIYRLAILREEQIATFELIPEAEYKNIRIYVSNLAKIRRLITGELTEMAYVSFIGDHRPGALSAVEAVDRALIGSSPKSSPIIGYFSLQDPMQAWVNLVLFDDLEMLSRWVKATGHADDWSKAAEFFSAIHKSVGRLRYADGQVSLEPVRMTVRDYDAVA